MIASRKGNIDIVRTLLAAGATCMELSIASIGYLEMSIRCGQPDIMRELINAGASLNLPPAISMSLNDSRTVEELLDAGQVSLSQGHAECLYYLLMKGIHNDQVLKYLFFSEEWKPLGGLRTFRFLHQTWCKAECQFLRGKDMVQPLDHKRALIFFQKVVVTESFRIVCSNFIGALTSATNLSAITVYHCLGWAVQLSSPPYISMF